MVLQEEIKAFSSQIDAFEAFEFSDVRFREDSFVILLIGERGQGKSISAAHYTERGHRKLDRKVFYFPDSLRLSYGEPLSISELVTFAELDTDEPTKFDGAILYLDEIHVLMSKYRANSWGNRMIQVFLSQIRKRGCDLFGTTNSPNQLDEALIDAVDFHGMCKKWTDPSCKKASAEMGIDPPRHLKNCRDKVTIRWADTKKRFGRSRKYRDGVKRKFAHIHGLVNKYGRLYNTDAVASAIEISQLSKESIVDAAESAKTGNEYEAFVVLMQTEIIPSLVEAGGEWIYPNVFSSTIESQWNIKASKERIGKACSDLGLEKKRGSGGTRYKLPDAEKLSLFLSGVG